MGGSDLSFFHVGAEMVEHHAPQAIALVEVALLMGPAGVRESEMHASVRGLAEFEARRGADGIARSLAALPFDLMDVLRGDLPDESRSPRILQRPRRADATAARDVGHGPALEAVERGQGVANLGMIGGDVDR